MTYSIGLLRFEEHYFPRIWGGQHLRALFQKPIPPNVAIGEAWLVSDHPSAQSVILRGKHQGKTLQELMREHVSALLGTAAKPTPGGRFPLLLKLLDAEDVLSVQVHPDDAAASRLGEKDVGKTEMWFVLRATPNSRLYCGLQEKTTREDVLRAVAQENLDAYLVSYPVQSGDAVMVPAGTVHAIGAGLVLAEIQQNSDLTYRLYDWGRLQEDGKPRALHLDKATEVIHYGQRPPRPTRGFVVDDSDTRRIIFGACRYFAAELVSLSTGWYTRDTRNASFHLLLGVAGNIMVETDTGNENLSPGDVVLVPAELSRYSLRGTGEVLTYYVPEIETDIIRPLVAANYRSEQIYELISPEA